MCRSCRSGKSIISGARQFVGVFFAASVLSACVAPDYPEDPRLSDESDLPSPVIVPLDDVLGRQQSTAKIEDAATNLQAQGEDLRRRADAVRNAPPE